MMTREDFAAWELVALRFEELQWPKAPHLWPPGDVLIRAAAVSDTRDFFMLERARVRRYPLQCERRSPELLACLSKPMSLVLGKEVTAWGGQLAVAPEGPSR